MHSCAIIHPLHLELETAHFKILPIKVCLEVVVILYRLLWNPD